MKKKLVSHTLESLPPMTARRVTKLRLLSQRPDREIDTSENPEMTDAQWVKAKKYRGLFHSPAKQQITTRLDADVVAWLKEQGKGYQARMNDILRQAMLASGKAPTR